MENRAHRLQAGSFKALVHPTRIAILEMLRAGPASSCQMEPILGLRQSNVAQHLAILRESHLVTSYRDGSRVMYAVTDERVFEMIGIMNSIIQGRMQEAAKVLAGAGQDAA